MTSGIEAECSCYLVATLKPTVGERQGGLSLTALIDLNEPSVPPRPSHLHIGGDGEDCDAPTKDNLHVDSSFIQQ